MTANGQLIAGLGKMRRRAQAKAKFPAGQRRARTMQ
jgi:hypothetical protein